MSTMPEKLFPWAILVMARINTQLKHIAFIMDGNARWAKKYGYDLRTGYLQGMRTLSKIALWCESCLIPYATFYAFSTENWQRPASWVSDFMALALKFFKEDVSIGELKKADIKLRILGDISKLSQELQDILLEMVEETKNKKTCEVSLAINYGGRDEIVRACQKVVQKSLEITKESISSQLDTYGIPDPDLVVRTGGRERMSNFLLWQSAYSELFFTDILWPNFDEKTCMEAIQNFDNRDRTYGQ